MKMFGIWVIRLGKIKIYKKTKIKTCVVKAGDEQKPLSLDSPGFKRIEGEIN